MTGTRNDQLVFTSERIFLRFPLSGSGPWGKLCGSFFVKKSASVFISCFLREILAQLYRPFLLMFQTKKEKANMCQCFKQKLACASAKSDLQCLEHRCKIGDFFFFFFVSCWHFHLGFGWADSLFVESDTFFDLNSLVFFS